MVSRITRETLAATKTLALVDIEREPADLMFAETDFANTSAALCQAHTEKGTDVIIVARLVLSENNIRVHVMDSGVIMTNIDGHIAA